VASFAPAIRSNPTHLSFAGESRSIGTHALRLRGLAPCPSTGAGFVSPARVCREGMRICLGAIHAALTGLGVALGTATPDSAPLHPGLLSRRASGTRAFCMIAASTSPSTWWAARVSSRLAQGCTPAGRNPPSPAVPRLRGEGGTQLGCPIRGHWLRGDVPSTARLPDYAIRGPQQARLWLAGVELPNLDHLARTASSY
jgi:hypothetical protein